MKLVVKNIIIMCLLSVVFSLFGCSPQPVKTDSEISSISITQNHNEITATHLLEKLK